MPNDLLLDDRHLRRDLDLLIHAVQGRWQLPPETLERVTRRALELVEHPEPRVATKAIAVVVEIATLNQRDRHKFLDLATRPQPAPSFRQTNNTQINLTSDDVFEMLTGKKTFEEILQYQ